MPTNCPCGTGLPYPECCGRAHTGSPAATAEALMRSRYSAFALGDRDYLLRSWHPDTRPRTLQLDRDQQWVQLEIVRTTGGTLLHTEGTVEFRAHYRAHGHAGFQHEHSHFTKHNGHWHYVGEVPA
ncbi:YchJ family metal-binding protein [Actinokineospora sp. NBRC 105648]|uniref:YchJ family protein n=1 Tax=Actinokineospora sp. NBRC 105648 TaxID=3032206 RepID=UPI002554AE18|nr:YchJ family metal-binding protein [Actinokineospora sp. NBRC 105648]